MSSVSPLTSLSRTTTSDIYPDSSKPHSHSHDKPSAHASISLATRIERILWFLEEQFGDCVQPIEPQDSDIDLEKGKINMHLLIKIDEHEAIVRFDPIEVECKLEALRQRILAVLDRAIETVAPFVDLHAEKAVKVAR